jgi:hypothetical protein
VRNYAAYQCLKMKVVNFHSVAELIQPQIRQLSRKEADVNTLVVATERFSVTRSNTKGPDASKVLKDASNGHPCQALHEESAISSFERKEIESS